MTNQYNLRALECSLDFIENENNYYAMFPYAYTQCIRAKDLASTLYYSEQLPDEDFVAVSERIEQARTKMIMTIRAWTVAALERSKNKLTTQELVYSVFDVLFK